jgi:hypothetical protein
MTDKGGLTRLLAEIKDKDDITRHLIEAKAQRRPLTEEEIVLVALSIIPELPPLLADQMAVLKHLLELGRQAERRARNKWPNFPWNVDFLISAYDIRGDNKNEVLGKAFTKLSESKEWSWLESYDFETLKARYYDGDKTHKSYRAVKEKYPWPFKKTRESDD